MLPFLDPYQPGTSRCLRASLPREQARTVSTPHPPNCAIYGGTHEAVRWGGSHEGMSESDGISPTITACMTWALIPKSNSPPGLLKAPWSGLVRLEHQVSAWERGCLVDTGKAGGRQGGRASCPPESHRQGTQQIFLWKLGEGGGISLWISAAKVSPSPALLLSPLWFSTSRFSPVQSQSLLQMPRNPRKPFLKGPYWNWGGRIWHLGSCVPHSCRYLCVGHSLYGFMLLATQTALGMY